MSENKIIPQKVSDVHAGPASMAASADLQSVDEVLPDLAGKLSIQCKLSVGAADDPLEAEADNAADHVMRMTMENFVQRKCAHCEEEEKKVQRKAFMPSIQRKEAGGGSVASDAIASRITASRGGGTGLDHNTKSFMESRFDADFGKVKIHTGDEAAQLNRSLSAKAFTVGNDIFFNEGEYQPGSSAGKHLLAHELSHTFQNGSTIKRKTGEPAVREAAAPAKKVITLTETDISFFADQLHAATDIWGTDEEGVYRALQPLGQDEAQIRRFNSVYHKKYGSTPEKVVRDEMSGKELQFALELIGIKEGDGLIKELAQTDKEFELAAERLHSAMSVAGTDEEEIFAVLLPFHGHRDALDKLKTVYKTKFDKDLESELDSELSGTEAEFAKFQLEKYRYAEYEAADILNYIREEALKRAQNPPSIPPSSDFYKRLRDYYLKDYLADPTAAKGHQAIKKIGRPMVGRDLGDNSVKVTPIGGPERWAKDRWEVMGILWLNKQKIPPLPPRLLALPVFQNLKTLPNELGAATDILMVENWNKLKNVDVPHLIGKDNLERVNFDADVTDGGKNISQLMHWATGVKYSEQTADAMHELFLAYEMWHLEGWDVFGSDSLNDMIAEEQGRQLGVELAKGSAGSIKSEADLLPFLNHSFLEARAWVGSLLRMRKEELDKWILQKKHKKAVQHWDKNNQWDVWHFPTAYEQLASGLSIDDVKKSPMVGLQTEIYALLFEADIWEAANGPVKITELQKALIQGKLNHILAIFALTESNKFDTVGDAGLISGASKDLDNIGAGDVPISALK